MLTIDNFSPATLFSNKPWHILEYGLKIHDVAKHYKRGLLFGFITYLLTSFENFSGVRVMFYTPPFPPLWVHLGIFSLFRTLFKWDNINYFRPPAARVSGVVEESPGTLEYEVALFREASKGGDEQSENEVPVDQAVAIGTKLQLRATINSQQSGKTNQCFYLQKKFLISRIKM